MLQNSERDADRRGVDLISDALPFGRLRDQDASRQSITRSTVAAPMMLIFAFAMKRAM